MLKRLNLVLCGKIYGQNRIILKINIAQMFSKYFMEKKENVNLVNNLKNMLYLSNSYRK